jgi:hypothetical protein
MAVDTINLNEEQKRMAEANDKARKDKEQALLIAQAKKMQSLLSEMGYNEDSIKAFMDRNEFNSAWNANNKELKPKPEDTPESLEYYGQPADSSFNHINPIYKEAGQAGYAYNKDRGPTANGPIPPGYKGKLSTPPHYYNVDIGEKPVEKTFASNYPFRNDLDKKPEEVPADNTKAVPENWWLKQLTPEVNSALEAIAKRDPEAMMLPEVRELLQRSRDGYNKQIGIAAVAPWTNNPEQTMTLANFFREQGDKNLMDAADNLEKIRTRQLDATKAMADDLTRQKGNLAGLGSSVLNMQGQGLMSLPAVYEGAREAMTEANRVHETGDARLKSAQASLNSFLGSSIDAMLKTDKKNKAAGIQKLQEINDLVNSNGTSESAWYDTVDPETNEKKVGLISKLNELKPYLNQNSQADLTKRIDAMNEDLAAYKAAMATEKQHRATAFNAEMRGNQVFNTLANVGQSFKMPLTEISPISSEVGELEEAYGKSNQNDYKNNGYNSGNEQFELHGDNKIIKKNGGNNGGPPPVPKGNKAEASYKRGIDVLNRYRSARLAAANVQAALQEGNTTEAALTRANAELEKRALEAKNLITGLATQAYGGNDTAYVVLGALRSSPFGPEVMELGKLYTGQITTGVGKFNQKNDILDKQNAEIQKYLRELNLGL